MYKAVNTTLEFNKYTKCGYSYYHSRDLGALGIFLGGTVPWVCQKGFAAYRKALMIPVCFEHQHLKFITHSQHISYVRDPLPAYLGDREKCLESVYLNKGTEALERYNLCHDLGSGNQFLLQLLKLHLVLFLQNDTVGHQQVAPLFLELGDP